MKLEICMIIPGLPFDGETIKTKSLGGSETAGYYMAVELAKQGHRVTVFNNTEQESIADGVRYSPMQHAAGFIYNVPHDICIVQRAPELFAQPTAAKLNVLWCHDLALKRNDHTFRGAMWNIDKVMVLSDFMAQQYKEVHGLPDTAIWQTRNGIDVSLFDFEEEPARNIKQLIYAARPERGLDVLLRHVMPRVWEKDPEIELYLCGYNNPTAQLNGFYADLEQLKISYGDKVKNLGHLTKKELAKAYATSGVYVYPTPSPVLPNFAETSCITAMECQAAGLPIVTTKKGALPETIAEGAGILLDQESNIEAYADKFTAAIMHYVNDAEAWEFSSIIGKDAAKKFSWSSISKEWEELFIAEIAQLNDNVDRLARHLWKGSDIVALRHLREKQAIPADISEKIDSDFAFMVEEDGYRKQYEKIGVTHDLRVFPYVRNEPRYEPLRAWLNGETEIKSVLDYGCAHGSYAIHLSNDIPRVNITGIDIDKFSIEAAEKLAIENAKHHNHLEFCTIEDFKGSKKKYDCLMIQEVLEHVPEPWALIDDMEQHVKDDGLVYITVPFGPWEYDSYETYPHRCHIWHFDQHDLNDMLGDKKDLAIGSIVSGHSQRLNAPLGWWIAIWRKSDVAAKPVDIERKLKLQRPRQTVSANIMAGPTAHEQLSWCLEPIKDLVDELIIVDCGMTDEGRAIANRYGAKLIKGVDPRLHGFETPRNIGLEHCSMDWVLWIDTDERLVNHTSTHKYLRQNMFNGYGIRQHHFAIDTHFDPDMPVRLFRRGEHDGKQMRFYGMIHEHPELALNEGPGSVVILSDVNIAHTGYLTESVRQQRFNRNYPLLQLDKQKYPDRLLQKHFIMRDSILLASYELQSNGGVVTDTVARLCRETIELGREYFLGKSTYANIDSLNWYSQALAILGEGIEVAYNVSASPNGAQLNGGEKKARFANYDEFIKTFESQHRDSIEQYQHLYY